MSELAGGAVVIQPGELTSVEGSRRYRTPISREIGANQIAQTVSAYGLGPAQSRRNPSAEEVLYVLSGSGECFIDGYRYELTSGTAVYLPPGSIYQIESLSRDDALKIVSVCCPEEHDPEIGVASEQNDSSDTQPFRTIHESARPAIPTGDREFRLLVNEDLGARRVTQFLGIIPPGRAAMHYHSYEEAIYIIQGEGVVWSESSADQSTSDSPEGDGRPRIETAGSRFSEGTSIYLPRGVRHCLENTGRDNVKLLGVFYPSGSPAVSYDD
jgi:mannose-6-phosphate isomerase-like protein (cupin superfamily)